MKCKDIVHVRAISSPEMVDCLVPGSQTFVIWHHSFIQRYYVQKWTFYGIDNNVNQGNHTTMLISIKDP